MARWFPSATRVARGAVVLSIAGAIVAASVATATGIRPRAGGARICPMRYGLVDGFRAGEITASASIRCPGHRSGTVVLTVTLQEWDAVAHEWRTRRRQSTRWHTPSKMHIGGFQYPCKNAKFRATFSGVLSKSKGHVISRQTHRLGPLQVFANCVVSFG